MDSIEVLTLWQVAQRLSCPVEAVKLLVARGELQPLTGTPALLFSLDSVEAHLRARLHPAVYQEALRAARRLLRYADALDHQAPLDALETHLLRLQPHIEAFVAALDRRDYTQVDALSLALWREDTDYEMLRRPLAPQD